MSIPGQGLHDRSFEFQRVDLAGVPVENLSPRAHEEGIGDRPGPFGIDRLDQLVLVIGVEEVRFPDGRKAGRVIGCPLTDELKQNVNNKASSCIPAIKVDFEEHWAGGVPFVEVIIPEGSNKPYCTAGGCYRIRVDGGNRALDPPALIAMVLERESRTFFRRFREATTQLEDALNSIAKKLEELKKTI